MNLPSVTNLSIYSVYMVVFKIKLKYLKEKYTIIMISFIQIENLVIVECIIMRIVSNINSNITIFL